MTAVAGEEIARRRARILESIAQAAERAGRRAEDVALMAVSKGHGAETVRNAARAGQLDERARHGGGEAAAPVRLDRLDAHLAAVAGVVLGQAPARQRLRSLVDDAHAEAAREEILYRGALGARFLLQVFQVL